MQLNTRALYKYSNRLTGKIEFHEKELQDKPEHMVLVRPPDHGAASAPKPKQESKSERKLGNLEGGL